MKVKPATTTVSEMREDSERWQKTADAVNVAAADIVQRGDGFGGKAFISDVAAHLRIPLERLAPLLLRFRQLGWVELDRADLVGALDPAKVKASELDDGIGRVHFVVVAPALPREWKENPAWLNRALAKNFDSLAETFPPEWQPRIKHPKTNVRGEMVVNFRELGCGTYGCVLETFDPDVVIKVTTDASEAEFVQLAGQWGWPDGITKYFGYEALNGRYRLSQKMRPTSATLLYRESASDVGKLAKDDTLEIDKVTGRRARAEAVILCQSIWDSGERLLKTLEPLYRAGDNVGAIYADARRLQGRAKVMLRGQVDPRRTDFWKELALDLKDAGDGVDLNMAVALEAYMACVHAMVENAAMRTVGKTLLFYAARGLVFADLHQGNFGVVLRGSTPTWVITDPGNIVALPEPW